MKFLPRNVCVSDSFPLRNFHEKFTYLFKVFHPCLFPSPKMNYLREGSINPYSILFGWSYSLQLSLGRRYPSLNPFNTSRPFRRGMSSGLKATGRIITEVAYLYLAASLLRALGFAFGANYLLLLDGRT